jgi:hypothetical protein
VGRIRGSWRWSSFLVKPETPGWNPEAELAARLSRASGAPSLLVVDQLEELFTLRDDEASAALD